MASEVVSTHIQCAIEILLRAHSGACMYRASGNSAYMATSMQNIKSAQNALESAMRDASDIKEDG